MLNVAAASEPPVLGQTEFKKFCDLAYDTCGIHLQQGKEQLVTARLLKVMRKNGITSFEEYYNSVLQDKSGRSLEVMINALTTNHTSFFREKSHFEFFISKILPVLTKRQQISVWSAACSSGEEPYSIAFTIIDHLGESALSKIHVTATDISTRVLTRAERGLFESDRVAALGTEYLRRYFLRGDGQWADWYMVKKSIREHIHFKRFNLIEDSGSASQFPLIFCRNVMIYFDSMTQAKVVNMLSRSLEPGGYLFIGHSESLGNTTQDLTFVAPAIYQKTGQLEVRGK